MKKYFALLSLSVALTGSVGLLPEDAQAQIQTTDSASFVVKPYLQIGRNPGPTNLTLMWHTADENVNWDVEWRMPKSQTWVRAEPPKRTKVAVTGITPRLILNSNLVNLESGKRFEYRLLKNGQPVFQSDAIAPKSAGQPYRFVAFGDVGAGTPEQKKMAERAWLSKPDMVVVPGDIVY
jgi:hypothetical protein